MTRSFPYPLISPGIPVFFIADPSSIKRPKRCPRIVSITISTSFPALNPGPKPIVIGAIFLEVPIFFFASIASITISGFKISIELPLGSTIIAILLCSKTDSNSLSE